MTTAEMATYAYDQIGRARTELNAVSKDLELNRSAHHLDERNRLLSPENGIGSAIEVVE
jgi:hypothetical protein